MSKLVKAAKAGGVIVFCLNALVKIFRDEQASRKSPRRVPVRPRTPKAALAAAYERAADDPEYVSEARRTADAWDATSADGLYPAGHSAR